MQETTSIDESPSPPRFGFVTLFAISALFQVVLATLAIRDGYFPTKEVQHNIPEGDWYWTANRFLMPSFLITGLISIFAGFSLIVRKYTRSTYYAGIIASVMTVMPIGIFLLIPLCKWIRRRRHFE
ncbi:hypothetical protein NT6N_24340 [Oceaniferula spumae]|uniref:Uncharacterized protein n=1 Tax=Oceaniferula spumae TaxID=2979115 RepID=A0AAT9FN54_9BACT